jgi:hypothetical protein
MKAFGNSFYSVRPGINPLAIGLQAVLRRLKDQILSESEAISLPQSALADLVFSSRGFQSMARPFAIELIHEI